MRFDQLPQSPPTPSWDVPHIPLPADAPASPAPAEASPAGKNTVPSEPTPPFPPASESPQVDTASDATVQVRFLNGVMDSGPSLRILAGNRLLSSSLAPGSFSEVFSLPAGFRLFTFFDANSPWLLLYRASIPLNAGDVVTLAMVRSANGLDLVRVDDRPCGITGTGWSCLRCVNLVYDSPGLDLVLTDGRVVFTDVRFKETTNYRRARPGRFDLYVAQTPRPVPAPHTDMETVEDLPRVVDNRSLPGLGGVEPLVSFFLDLRAGSQASVYLLGNWALSPQLTVGITENF